MTDHAAHAESVKKIADLIKSIDFGMLTTLDAEGRLHSRPMSSNKEVEFDGDVWFFTYASTPKVSRDREQAVCQRRVLRPENSDLRFAVRPRRACPRPRERSKQLWQPSLKAWFPKGLDEPDIALIKVNADQAEYWDSPASPDCPRHQPRQRCADGPACPERRE